MLIHFLLFKLIILSSASILKLKDLESLAYTELDCDYQVYLKLKDPPLDIQVGYEDTKNNIQYLLTDRFVVKRFVPTSFFNYSKHSLQTSEFYTRSKEANAFIFFSDGIMETKITKPQAHEIFFKNKIFTKHELDFYGYTNSQMDFDYRIFLYTNMNQSQDLLLFDYLIITERDKKTKIIHKEGTNRYREDENNIEKLPFDTDTILFSVREKNFSHEFIEFSNTHTAARQYHVLASNLSSPLNPITEFTYHSFLNCLSPICEGGRVKGLVSFGNKKLFIFIEQYYKQIDHSFLYKDGK